MFTRWSDFATLLASILFLSSTAHCGNKLERRSRLELKAGWWNAGSEVRTQVGIGGVVSSVSGDGFLGSLAYSRWLEENLAIVISAGALALEIETSVESTGSVSNHTLTVTPLEIGARYYLTGANLDSWRPYAAAGIGPVIGHLSRVTVDQQVVTESRSETAFGGHLGGGLDIQLGRLIMLGVSTGYYLMTNFPETLSDRKNYSGPEFGMSISLLFGKGID